jgi:hypothetical protein
MTIRKRKKRKKLVVHQQKQNLVLQKQKLSLVALLKRTKTNYFYKAAFDSKAVFFCLFFNFY